MTITMEHHKELADEIERKCVELEYLIANADLVKAERDVLMALFKLENFKKKKRSE